MRNIALLSSIVFDLHRFLLGGERISQAKDDERLRLWVSP